MTFDPSQKQRRWDASFPYDAEYNDHFETPLRAYQDVQPLLHGTLYDPYYCQGRAADHLKGLGFTVIHEKRDFYKDIQNNSIPDHDMLVTNPPYSEQHKKKCLSYCFKSQKPFFILLPAYIATKQYYSHLLQQYNQQQVWYLAPEIDYQYEHPEGTGNNVSPFRSVWFCGNLTIEDWDIIKGRDNPTLPRLCRSVEELQELGLVTMTIRKNPRRRKKRFPHLVATLDTQADRPKHHSASINRSRKISKYRDETGKRTRKRF